ncbi:hypothetical protein [Luteolibacter sp. LG18]|uniref:hypothetical protein n=1 Tax=Luteolibacter sp. LG18 TaxID=2819286 RepID=UPI002B2A5F7A|nr:hypothetical protein llg_25340 [Luteolibacter sp. LG18]
MGHHISGIIGAPAILRDFARENSLHAPAALKGGLAFLPLDDDHLEALFPRPGEFDPAMTYLSAALKDVLAVLSSLGPVAYVETDYFGGTGVQGATVYRDGRCVLEPRTEEYGVVSEALRLLGVAAEWGEDEFDAVGLGRHRSNEGWVEAGKK